MFRFTIRDMLWLTVIAAVCLGIGQAWLRADMWEEHVVVLGMFLLGVACYFVGNWLVRRVGSP